VLVSKSLSNRQAASQPTNNRHAANPCFARPCGQVLRSSVVSQHPVISLVCRLLVLCCPTAVSRLVVAVVVGVAIKCVLFCRRITHVSIEICELQPPLAHANATATVVAVLLHFSIIAAVNHRVPNPIDAGAGLAVNVVGSHEFMHPASAANRVSFSQLLRSDYRGISAVTVAEPFNRFDAFGSSNLPNNEPAKSLACDVDKTSAAIFV